MLLACHGNRCSWNWSLGACGEPTGGCPLSDDGNAEVMDSIDSGPFNCLINKCSMMGCLFANSWRKHCMSMQFQLNDCIRMPHEDIKKQSAGSCMGCWRMESSRDQLTNPLKSHHLVRKAYLASCSFMWNNASVQFLSHLATDCPDLRHKWSWPDECLIVTIFQTFYQSAGMKILLWWVSSNFLLHTWPDWILKGRTTRRQSQIKSDL